MDLTFLFAHRCMQQSSARSRSERLLPPALAVRLSVGLSISLLLLSFCQGPGGQRAQEVKRKDLHFVLLYNHNVPLCASPGSESKWHLHISQL